MRHSPWSLDSRFEICCNILNPIFSSGQAAQTLGTATSFIQATFFKFQSWFRNAAEYKPAVGRFMSVPWIFSFPAGCLSPVSNLTRQPDQREMSEGKIGLSLLCPPLRQIQSPTVSHILIPSILHPHRLWWGKLGLGYPGQTPVGGFDSLRDFGRGLWLQHSQRKQLKADQGLRKRLRSPCLWIQDHPGSCGQV